MKTKKGVNMRDKFNMLGKTIEAFSLPNSRGETVDIKEILGIKNILISLSKNTHKGSFQYTMMNRKKF